MVQLAPPARLEPQVFPNMNEEALAPVILMPKIDSGALPMLVKVTDCDALPVPTTWIPYDRLFVEKVSGTGRPIPLSGMLCVA